MIDVRVRAVGPIRRIVGARELNVVLQEGAAIRSLLAQWVEQYGDAFAAWVTDRKGQLTGRYVRFLVNGRDASILDGLDTVLSDGDCVSMIAAVAGGV